MIDLTDYNELRSYGVLKLVKKLNTFDYNNIDNIFYMMSDIVGKQINYNDLRRIHKTMNNKSNKVYRIKKRITKILEENNEPIFITLTFNDESLNKLTDHRQVVYRFLNRYCEDYIANIDFGSQKGRLHFHCVASNRIDPTKWKYGACNVIQIYNNRSGAMAEYINKFTLHASKVTTKNFRIITKRRSRK